VEPLFSKGDLLASLDAELNNVRKAVDELTRNEILSVSEEDLVAHFVSRFRVDPLRLHRNAMHLEEAETEINVSGDPWRDVVAGQRVTVPGTKLTVVVPFSGDRVLLDLRSNQSTTSVPRAEVKKDAIHLIYTERDLEADAMRSRTEHDVSQIERWIGFQEGPINDFNAKLEQHARSLIEQRRGRILKAEGAVAAIGLPVKRRGDTPTSYPVPGVRRAPKNIKPRPLPTADYQPEFAINDAQYDEILTTIAQMTDVIERNPHAFAHLGEEALRTHLLVPLNSAFEGGATAETFNYEGKSDILIRHEGRVVFVAECKIWKGAKTLMNAIQQIRGYLSWRDTKAAVILFVRNRDFSAVVNKIVPAVEAADGWKRTIGQVAETTFRFTFGHRDDSNREIVLSVVLLAVPSPEALPTPDA
jgi:hypothetical protein